jgi:hypothetical protein
MRCINSERVEWQLHEMRGHERRCRVSSRAARTRVHMRANACTSRGARAFTRRKCLIYARECFFIHVMRFSTAAVARSDSSTPVGFGAGHRTDRKDFIGCDRRAVGVTEIAASMDAKFTARAGFEFAVS